VSAACTWLFWPSSCTSWASLSSLAEMYIRQLKDRIRPGTLVPTGLTEEASAAFTEVFRWKTRRGGRRLTDPGICSLSCQPL